MLGLIRGYWLWVISAGLLGVQLLNAQLNYALNDFGLIPRQLKGVLGILSAPWLHGSWGHLFSNLCGLWLIGSLVLLRSIPDFLRASVLINLLAGAGVWVFAREGIHLGASGWVFGLLGLFSGRALLQKNALETLFSILALLLLSGAWLGLEPFLMSFEFHLAGFGAGLLYAFWQPKPCGSII